MTIGFYMMVSRLLENLEVELEETNVEHLEGMSRSLLNLRTE
jgi:hypothetical protein